MQAPAAFVLGSTIKKKNAASACWIQPNRVELFTPFLD
jgi:hypothetical protein